MKLSVCSNPDSPHVAGNKMNLTKKQRIAISIVVFLLFCILSSYRTIKENSREYRAHPSATLLGAAMPSIIVAFWCYWLLGIQRKQHNWNIPFLKARSVDKSKKDDWAFEQAASELESGAMDKSVWARAFSECKGDESASKARYISIRVERLVSQVILDEQNKVDAQAESDESIKARRNVKWLLVGSTIASVIAFIYLANRNSALVETENASVSPKLNWEDAPVSSSVDSGTHLGLQAPKVSGNSPRHLDISGIQFPEHENKLRLGMTKKEVVSLVGVPWGKQVIGLELERWDYGREWVYFEHGLVSLITTKE